MSKTGNLRHRAATFLKQHPRPTEAGSDALKLAEDPALHQVELEMQNDELRRAHEVIEQSRQELCEFYDFAPVGYFTFDRAGVITRLNLTGASLLARDRNKLVGRPFVAYLSPGHGKAFQSHLAAALGDSRKHSTDLAITTPEDKTAFITMESVALRDGDGEVRVLSSVTDVTERKRLEDEIPRLEEELRRAQKLEALGVLAGGIAHDFNNMLAAVVGFTEIAKGKLAEESPVRRYLDRVLTAGIRGRELVRQILLFTRKADQDRKPLHLSTVVEESLKLLRATLPSTIDIKVQIESESSYVFADPTQIQQILMNLVTNAAHAIGSKGGSIEVHLADFSFISPDRAPDSSMSPGLYMKLSVTDTGEGIPAAIMGKIFDPFFTTKGAGEGTGLGLSVVHGIVASHKGAITVTSTQGKGSTFDVYLPKYRTPQPESIGAYGEDIPRGHERLLFVDDEEALVEMGSEILAGLGYRVVAKTSSREALALLRLDPSRFDLVITDQTMPGMTGTELASEVLALRPDMPVILCTGFSHVVDADMARSRGVRAFAMKPLTKKEIAKVIRKALDNEAPSMDSSIHPRKPRG